jgi:hypothetical protein
MRREQLPLYAMALAVLMVGLAFAGVPMGTLIVLLIFLACPLMMIFMMRGMDHGSAPRDRDDHEHLPHAGEGHDETPHSHGTSTR